MQKDFLRKQIARLRRGLYLFALGQGLGRARAPKVRQFSPNTGHQTSVRRLPIDSSNYQCDDENSPNLTRSCRLLYVPIVCELDRSELACHKALNP